MITSLHRQCSFNQFQEPLDNLEDAWKIQSILGSPEMNLDGKVEIWEFTKDNSHAF